MEPVLQMVDSPPNIKNNDTLYNCLKNNVEPQVRSLGTPQTFLEYEPVETSEIPVHTPHEIVDLMKAKLADPFPHHIKVRIKFDKDSGLSSLNLLVPDNYTLREVQVYVAAHIKKHQYMYQRYLYGTYFYDLGVTGAEREKGLNIQREIATLLRGKKMVELLCKQENTFG